MHVVTPIANSLNLEIFKFGLGTVLKCPTIQIINLRNFKFGFGQIPEVPKQRYVGRADTGGQTAHPLKMPSLRNLKFGKF